MAIDTTNIQAAIAAKIAAEDSAVTALELLQYGVGLSEYGAAQYYTSADSLPTADNDLKGMIALVYTGDLTSGNGLYLCTGTEWFEMQDLDSAAPPTQAQGSNFGYTSGGLVPVASNVIEKFSFSSDANATDVGDITVARYGPAGQSSTDNGYTSGGRTPTPTYSNVVDKFPFSSDGNATDVGDLTVARGYAAGQSSTVSGYTSGGLDPGAPTPGTQNIIDKFPFASDANATDVGDLILARYSSAGQSSTDNGYTSGGAPSVSNVIQKFPFASDGNASDVGDLTVTNANAAGQNSTVSGYVSGGFDGTFANILEKFPFASDTNATDVGDLSILRWSLVGQSSTDNGYTSGGGNPPTVYNVIDKFPFASDANATDVGDLTEAKTYAAGQQY